MGAVKAFAELGNGVCPPSEGINEQALRVVIVYIDSRPARLHEGFNSFLADILDFGPTRTFRRHVGAYGAPLKLRS